MTEKMDSTSSPNTAGDLLRHFAELPASFRYVDSVRIVAPLNGRSAGI